MSTFGFGAAKPASAVSFGAFGSSASAAGGFGASTAAAPAAGGFGAPAAGGFGAPAAAGGFGASTGGAFGAPATTGGAFGGFGAASTGGAFGGFGAASTGGAFGAASTGGAFGAASTGGAFGAASTGGAFGGFGAASTGGAFGAGAFGAPAAAGAGMMGMQAQQQQPNAGQAKHWLSATGQPVVWRTQYKDLPDLLKRKMNQHQVHIKECKQHSETIRGILERRELRYGRPPGAGASWRPDTDVSSPLSGNVQLNTARIRHWLNSLKASLTYDRGQLDTLQGDVERLTRQMSAVRAHASSQHAHFGSSSSTHDATQQFLLGLVSDLDRAMRETDKVMNDLESIIEGSIKRPSSYPPELIEHVFWHSESFWNAMSSKVATLHHQAERCREGYLSLLRAYDPVARNPFSHSESIKIVLQVSVTGIKFNREWFLDAMANKLSIHRQRLRCTQIDPLDNAILVNIEEGEQPGYPCDQVANTLRRLFTEGDVQLAHEPISAFSIQIGRDEPIVHPAASPHIEDATGLGGIEAGAANIAASSSQATATALALAAPAAATGAAPAATSGFGAPAATSGFGAPAAGGFGAPAAGGFGASAAAATSAPAFGAASTGGAFGGFGAPAAGGFGAPAAGGFGSFGAAAPATTFGAAKPTNSYKKKK